MFVLVVDVKTDDFVLSSAVERKTVEVVGRVVTDADDRCLLYTSPSPRDATLSRMPSSA